MGYADPNSIHNPATGTVAPAAWGDQLRDNDVFFANPPTCRVYNSANESINNATDTALTFNSERFDTDTIHSTVSNTSRLTATTAGKYLIFGHAQFAPNATGTRKVFIRLNGTTNLGTIEVPNNGGAANVELPITTIYQLAATDYVELVVFQNSGGALNVNAGASQSPEFGMLWVSL